ncbi:helix-turn-helix domain-containing protein [Methylomonas methanica]|uniref:Helix-turn-helix domain protein n=1 Tax=Methylomonas methanica (strain DSM 25384 / MC09) TaxID=857087 RepID=F9ZX06_METMM|nr:helix-turn-helix transcriptional regulator [Methylomonas methanica]AEF98467.1 helix-turn-helix domain protein [Methylomonas methanica MC09]
MNPFACFLHTIRMQRGIRQTELSDLIGYEQTYISALEIGKKGPPTPEFVEKLITALDLKGEEREHLLKAVEASNRKLVIDSDMPQDVFWMLQELRDRVSDLTLAEIQLIRQVLKLKESYGNSYVESGYRLHRRKKMEAQM